MLLKRRFQFFTPSVLAPGTNTILGTTTKFQLDRTWPCEAMLVIVSLTMGSTGPTFNTGAVGGYDGLLSVMKRINIAVNDGNQPRTVVDFSGVGLCEYAQLIGASLDRSTIEALRIGKLTAGPNNQKIRIAYLIPFVHPGIAEPLKTRCLLPLHTYPQDPVVTIDWETSGNLYSAGSIATVSAEYMLIRREMPTTLNGVIMQSGGYLPFDLIETPFSIPTGTGTEQRIPVATPGQYANLMFRQYLGGTNITRDVVDGTTTFGSESTWRLETGGLVIKQWRWKHLQILNDLNRFKNGITSANFAAATSAGSPTVSFDPDPDFGAVPAASSSFQPAASTLLDFLIAGTSDTADELGSLLDCNLPANSGLKMEVIGTPSSVTTNGSVIYIGGHRFFGDLSKYQSLNA